MAENKLQEISLAQFIAQKRESMGLSQSGLAKRANVDVGIIEDVESGKDLFLSSTLRQKLARALKLELVEIKFYEKTQLFNGVHSQDFTEEQVELKEKILAGETELDCPACGSKLTARIARLYDIYDNLVLHAKAVCTKCPFQIR